MAYLKKNPTPFQGEIIGHLDIEENLYRGKPSQSGLLTKATLR